MSERAKGLGVLEFNRSRIFAGILVIGFLINYRGVLGLEWLSAEFKGSLDRAVYDPADGYALIGVVVFLLLTSFRIELIRAAWGASGSWVAGLSTLVLGTSLLVWAHQVSAIDLLLPALVLQLASLALILGGGALLRAIAVPLLALIVATPLPAMAINLLVFPMQMITVSLTSFLLNLVERSHLVAGDLLVTNGIVFQVIEGCSGLKTMMSLTLASIAFADLTGRDWREKSILILIAPFIAVAVNGFRVLILVLREVSAESSEHMAYGLLMIVVGVVILAVVEWILSRTLFVRWRRASSVTLATGSSTKMSPPPDRRLAMLSLIVISSALILLFIPAGRASSVSSRAFNIETLPRVIDGWVAQGIRFDNSFLGSVWFRHRIYRSYEKDGVAIRVFVGLEDLPMVGRSGFSAKTMIPRSGWISIEQNAVSRLGLNAELGGEFRIRYQNSSVLVHHSRFGYAPWGWELVSTWLGLDRKRFGGADVALVVRLETDIVNEDRVRAKLRLRQMAESVEEWGRPLGRSSKTRNTRG